jgi:hypothetical protein
MAPPDMETVLLSKAFRLFSMDPPEARLTVGEPMTDPWRIHSRHSQIFFWPAPLNRGRKERAGYGTGRKLGG